MERFLKSRYRIGKKISENPYTITYLGSYLSGDKQIIIKIYKRATLNSSLIKEIRQKIKAFSLVHHHGIARIVDGDYGWQGFYYVREYVEGKSLREILKMVRTVDSNKASQIISDICEALEVAHKNGVIHGSISPENIIVSSQKIVKLTDFVVEGQIKESLPQKATHLTNKSAYLSPEEIIGESATPSSDIYATGLVFYEMLCGQLPFEDDEKAGLTTALSKLREQPTPLTTHNAAIPKILNDIIMKALERDPLLRFASINELAQSLNNKSIITKSPIQDIPTISYDSSKPISKEKLKEKKHIRMPKNAGQGFSYQLGNWLVKFFVIAIIAGVVLGILLTLIR